MKIDILSVTSGGIEHCDQANYAYGGSGNIAAALSLLGISSYFVGKAGNDALGELYQNDLQGRGIMTKIFLDSKLPTGLLVSIIDNNAERSFLIARGANNNLTIEEISRAIDEIEYELLYISGYSLVNSPQRDAIMYAAKRSYEKGVRIFFDPGAFNTIDKSRQYYEDIMKMFYILSANADEAKALSQTSNVDDALHELSKIVPIVVIKLGKAGCIISAEGTEIRIPAPITKPVDSTGAGDAFNAAFIFGIKKGWTYEKIATFANWFASKKVEQIGARAFPGINEIDGILNRFHKAS